MPYRATPSGHLGSQILLVKHCRKEKKKKAFLLISFMDSLLIFRREQNKIDNTHNQKMCTRTQINVSPNKKGIMVLSNGFFEDIIFTKLYPFLSQWQFSPEDIYQYLRYFWLPHIEARVPLSSSRKKPGILLNISQSRVPYPAAQKNDQVKNTALPCSPTAPPLSTYKELEEYFSYSAKLSGSIESQSINKSLKCQS